MYLMYIIVGLIFIILSVYLILIAHSFNRLRSKFEVYLYEFDDYYINIAYRDIEFEIFLENMNETI